MRLHQIPYVWKKQLWQSTDANDWLVFCDWCEEHGHDVLWLRYLVGNGTRPLYQQRLLNTVPSGREGWCWTFYESHPNTLPVMVYAGLPVFTTNFWRDNATYLTLGIDTGNDIVVVPPLQSPSGQPRYVTCAKWYASAIGAYLAILRTWQTTLDILLANQKTSGSGSLPNWAHQALDWRSRQ